MPSERVLETDVLVVGGGLGGCVAAIRARESGVDVTLVDKAYVSKSGASAFASGGFLAVFDPEVGLDADAWMDWAVSIGEYINNRDWVEVQIKESYANFQNLISWGVPFKEEQGEIPQVRQSPGGNCVVMRPREFTPALRKKALKSGVKILDGITVTDLLKQDGRVVGAVGFDTRDGDFHTFRAKATILATGSGGFKTPTTARDYRTADGEAMSYRIGAEITGKEFHNKVGGGYRKFPYGCCEAGAGAHTTRSYLNAEGEEFIQKYATGLRAKAYFRFSSDIFFEAHAGRAPIFWNLDAVTPEARKKMIAHQQATRFKMLADRCGIDAIKGGKLDYFDGGSVGDSGEGCGGVRLINTKCESSIPGLYVVGDTAGTYLCGSSYNGVGSGLSNAALTGYRAGENAAEHVLKVEKPIIDEKEVARLKEVVYGPLNRKGGFSPGWVTQMIQNIIVPYYIMQVKHGKRLQAALTMIEFLQRHCGPMVKAEDFHGLRMANEVRNMLLNAEMMLKASLFRTESRGSHYREDYPRRNDPDWLAWTVLKEEQGETKLSKLPIPKEWWPDLSKPYEERYDWRFPKELDAGLKPYQWPDA